MQYSTVQCRHICPHSPYRGLNSHCLQWTICMTADRTFGDLEPVFTLYIIWLHTELGLVHLYCTVLCCSAQYSTVLYCGLWVICWQCALVFIWPGLVVIFLQLCLFLHVFCCTFLFFLCWDFKFFFFGGGGMLTIILCKRLREGWKKPKTSDFVCTGGRGSKNYPLCLNPISEFLIWLWSINCI